MPLLQIIVVLLYSHSISALHGRTRAALSWRALSVTDPNLLWNSLSSGLCFVLSQEAPIYSSPSLPSPHRRNLPSAAQGDLVVPPTPTSAASMVIFWLPILPLMSYLIIYDLRFLGLSFYLNHSITMFIHPSIHCSFSGQYRLCCVFFRVALIHAAITNYISLGKRLPPAVRTNFLW